jgi:hypothetical protein
MNFCFKLPELTGHLHLGDTGLILNPSSFLAEVVLKSQQFCGKPTSPGVSLWGRRKRFKKGFTPRS